MFKFTINNFSYYVSLLIACFFIWGFQVKAISSTNVSSTSLKWDTVKLTWDDFQMLPPADKSAMSANTTSGIQCKTSLKNHEVVITCGAYFEKLKSWTKLHDSVLLRHEQLHFDIAELHARYIKKELKSSIRLKGDYKKIKQILQSNIQALEQYQQLYDEETNHGLNIENQAIWEQKIAQLLLEYSNHQDDVISVTLN
ncbi:MAG: DUF922 domain-containing protein [Chitinophagaceae bacterium]|nr:DUF922 domain-containing protein [Chitinophagaceae bacterium]